MFKPLKCVHTSGVHQGNEENEESCPAPISRPSGKIVLLFSALSDITFLMPAKTTKVLVQSDSPP
jgi:hypothetical protein